MVWERESMRSMELKKGCFKLLHGLPVWMFSYLFYVCDNWNCFFKNIFQPHPDIKCPTDGSVTCTEPASVKADPTTHKISKTLVKTTFEVAVSTQFLKHPLMQPSKHRIYCLTCFKGNPDDVCERRCERSWFPVRNTNNHIDLCWWSILRYC